jgi:hypothetical protein
MSRELNISSTRLVDKLQNSEVFFQILSKGEPKDIAIASTAVIEVSKIGNMVKFYEEYKTYLKNESDSPQARQNPQSTAKKNMLEALSDYGAYLNEDAWHSVIEEKVDVSELERQVPTRGMLLNYFKSMERKD